MPAPSGVVGGALAFSGLPADDGVGEVCGVVVGLGGMGLAVHAGGLAAGAGCG